MLVLVTLLGSRPFLRPGRPTLMRRRGFARAAKMFALRLEGLILLGFAGTDFVITMTLSRPSCFCLVSEKQSDWLEFLAFLTILVGCHAVAV